MQRQLIGTVVGLALYACGGDGTGPSAFNLTGTFIGEYTVTLDPGTVYQGVLELTQHVNNVSGSLTTNSGRSANVSGSLSGTRLTASFNFTDVCGGSASATANVTNNGTRLTGNYTASDCIGGYSGGFVLDKQ